MTKLSQSTSRFPLRFCALLFLGAAATSVLPVCLAADWPAYRGDNTRSSFLASEVSTDLRLAWQFTPAAEPQPAWPPPARGSYWQNLTSIAARIVDDHTFHPVIANGKVLFGSSADDSVTCLDAATGKVHWQTTTGGPVRYAPAVAGEKVYVGSDDGQLYCLSLKDGKQLWRKRLAKNDRLVPGNGRMISPWPVRTGAIVEEGVVYAAAGLYPSQGVFVFAFDAESGEQVWETKINHTAHGYLLLTDDYLVVPTGRTTPLAVRKADGVATGVLPGAPGTYAVIAGEQVLSGRGNDGSLTASDVETRQSLLSFQAEQICVGPVTSYLLSKQRLTAVRLHDYVELSRRVPEHDKQLQEAIAQAKSPESSEIKALVAENKRLHTERDACRQWEQPAVKTGAIASCDSFVAIGGEGGVELRRPKGGRLIKKLPVDGIVVGLAISGDQLVASTRKGQLYCFTNAAGKANQIAAKVEKKTKKATNPWEDKVASVAKKNLIPTFGGTRGYALLLGANDPQLALALAHQTDYTIVVVDDDSDRVASLRRSLLETGLYGHRVAVQFVEAGPLPFADYVFNFVVSSAGLAGQPDPRWRATEVERVSRPFGGVAWLSADASPSARGPLAGAGKWVHQYGNTAATADSGDEHLSRPLRLQWFGGPGPARMVDRHLRAPAPLINQGRMFVTGENAIVCVDSFNGTEYWQLDAPNSQRYSMPYDCGYFSTRDDQFAIAVRNELWLIDVATGEVTQKVRVPAPWREGKTHWGYAALANDRIYGTWQLATASRTEPSRQQIDTDYRNDQPIVTGRAIFAMDASSKRKLWDYRGAILNPTISITEERVYFVVVEDKALASHPTGRIRLADYMPHHPFVVALDAETGKVVWKQPLPEEMIACLNILYLQATDGRLILSGSRLFEGDSWYRVAVLDRDSGDKLWSAEHAKGRAGAFTHGEQVHHPVVLGNMLVCEPVLYDLTTGERIAPPGEVDSWSIQRPGHSCGTLSGAGECLLFRAGNPTLLDLGEGPKGSDRFFNISPTRPGCWINIIAADGLVLIPEASASCVCHYSLQTSMAFQPVGDGSNSPPKEQTDFQ